MLSYRNLSEDDCDFILQKWVGHSSIFRENRKDELRAKITDMNTKQYDGRYYEIFGLLNDNVLVGTFSLNQREKDIPENVVYFGIEIDGENRGKGYATKAVSMACDIAKAKGYSKIFSQTRTDNTASVKLHEKCGFEIIEKTINSKGNEVYNYLKTL